MFELNTDNCGFITIETLSKKRVTPDYAVQLKIWHDTLVAPEPAEAAMAFAIDGEVVWEATLPIPSDPGILEEPVTLEAELPKGTPLQFHVHNHGNNAYDLYDVIATLNAD